MPVDSDCHGGRIPVLDEDGYLMIAMLHKGKFFCETTPVCWMIVAQTKSED